MQTFFQAIGDLAVLLHNFFRALLFQRLEPRSCAEAKPLGKGLTSLNEA